jgi:nucleotide-binding universal stress UspA family protein
MLKIDTILTPIDFSDKSRAAAEQAVALAMHFDAAMLFLHVIPSTSRDPELLGGPDFAGAEAAEAKQRLEELAAEVSLGGDAQALVERGDPARRIAVTIEERQVDLAVLPTHGHGLFRRLLLGSVTAKVLHDVKIPVLTGVHMEDRPPFAAGPYRKIGCAVALRDRATSERVLRWAWSFAQSWSAELHVIHVPPAIDWGAGEWFPDETQQLVREASLERLQELIESVGCEAVPHTAGLEATPYVLQVVREQSLDALVVGRSVSHGLLGGFSVDAFPLIRAAPCPVFSI